MRVALGLTQLALAEILGVSKSLISMVENDKRHLPFKALVSLGEMETAVAFGRRRRRKLSPSARKPPALKAPPETAPPASTMPTLPRRSLGNEGSSF